MATLRLHTLFLPADGDAAIDKAARAARLRCIDGSPWAGTATLLDTFDGRLSARRLTLQLETRGRRRTFRLSGARAHETTVVPAGRLPSKRALLADDLPDELQAVAAVLGVRCLLPLLEYRFECKRTKLVDKRGKTRAVLTSRSGVVRGLGPLALSARLTPRGQAVAAPPLCTVEVRKGDPGPAKAFIDTLTASGGIDETDERFARALVSAAGVNLEARDSRPRLLLHRGMSAGQVLAELLRAAWRQMAVNEAGAARSADIEFLHDFRVAARRARSWLARLKRVVEPTVLAELQQELRWLGGVTGPVRDLDVFALELERYRKWLTAADAAALEPLATAIGRTRRSAQRRLAGELTGARYRQFMMRYETLLQRMAERSEGLTGEASALVSDVAIAALRKQWRRVNRAGRRIGHETAAIALHDLRIECKKLRYLLEAFASLFPEDAMLVWLKALKRLQNNLGRFQDLEVQQDRIRECAGDLAKRGQAPVETVLAMGRLVELLAQRQAHERRRFAGRWQQFDTDAVNALRRQLLQ